MLEPGSERHLVSVSLEHTFLRNGYKVVQLQLKEHITSAQPSRVQDRQRRIPPGLQHTLLLLRRCSLDLHSY